MMIMETSAVNTVSTSAAAAAVDVAGISSSSQQQQPRVPSFTRQITKNDAERFLEASHALETCLEDYKKRQHHQQQQTSSSSSNNKNSNKSTRGGRGQSKQQQKKEGDTNDDVVVEDVALHEMLYEAAKECQHPYILSFLDRLSSSSSSTSESSTQSSSNLLSPQEVQAGVLLFFDCGKTAKLRHLFRVFGTRDEITPTNAESMFRAVLTALACCCGCNKSSSSQNEHRNHRHHENTHSNSNVIVEGKPANSPRPLKRCKVDHHDDDGEGGETETHTTKALTTATSGDSSSSSPPSSGHMQQQQEFHDDDEPHPTSSFDSSLATLHSEDTNDTTATTTPSNQMLSEHTRREIEDIVRYASDELIQYATTTTTSSTTGTNNKTIKDENKDDGDDDETTTKVSSIAFSTFSDWYNAHGGNSVVRWLELIQLSKWKKHTATAGAAKSPCVPRKKTHPNNNNNNNAVGQQQQQQQSQPPRQQQQHSASPPLAAAAAAALDSPASLTNEEAVLSPTAAAASHSVISFDFSTSSNDANNSLCINISNDNLSGLQELVVVTGLQHVPAADICKTLLHVANRRMSHGELLLTLTRDDFQRILPRIIPQHYMDSMSTTERDGIYRSLLDFFWLYQGSPNVNDDEADLKELAIGLCFFCAGNKSNKLSTGFELLDEKRRGYLSEQDLFGYLRSYLMALVALSFFLPTSKQQTSHHLYHGGGRPPVVSAQRREAIRAAVESGAKWTLGHFLSYLTPSPSSNDKSGMLSFEGFAHWYSTGGFNVAPWLELLDLNKVFSLTHETSTRATTSIPMASSSPLPLTAASTFPPNAFQTAVRRPPPPRDRMSSLRRHHSSRNRDSGGDGGQTPEVLFSFPLAGRRSLVVLKEDATYVREVVEAIGLLSKTPDSLWTAISKSVQKRRKKSQKNEPAIYVNSPTFVQCMQEVCPRKSKAGNRRKRSSPGRDPTSNHSVPELLSNFFQCFDIDQVDSVALDELMGGLTLLCGGKKSAKLAFAFGIFDTRPGIQNKKKKKDDIVHSLSGEDLFLFLRSILIVTFSCCRQSLGMTDDCVSRCIADTANMICNDVMRHQWETKQTDRLNFDEFGQWYNEGGFERAPWLELLDLKKWVLVEDMEAIEKRDPGGPVAGMMGTTAAAPSAAAAAPAIPPPPPEDALEMSFFDDTDNGHDIMHMDSFDDMDMMLMPHPSSEREMDSNGLRISKSFSFSSPRHSRSHPQDQQESPYPGPPALKFHMVTNGEEGGFMMGISKSRIDHFRQILEDSGITNVSAEDACKAILSKTYRSSSKTNAEPKITKEGFDSAMKSIIRWRTGTNPESKRTLSRMLDFVFAAFDMDGTGRSSVAQVACGIMVLCSGRKSEKLELAFETLDKNKRGSLTKKELTKYLQSFLTVLLSVAFTPDLAQDPAQDTLTTMNGGHCAKSATTLSRAVTSGAEWAASMAFEGRTKNGGSASISFDSFADWYTSKGFQSVPWLELISLEKWLYT